jgi:hypothetical protein
MKSTKALLLAVGVAGATLAPTLSGAETATESKPAAAATTSDPAKKTFTKAQIEAFLAQCSAEADARGLDVKKGKGAERKAFRRECMRKLGVTPKQ